MAEDNKAKSGKLVGWVKTGIGSVVMAAGGAALMYLTPLVDTVLKPDKPIANFGHSVSGLNVTFQNRASGAYEGWWDFGDGTPLEAFDPKQEAITHSYPRPGMYSAKLVVRNATREENERTVSVNLEGSNAENPAVEAFSVIPLRPDLSAPATFRILGKVKNADYCIWAMGEDRPLEISPDVTGTLDRLVTLKEPGYYTFRLVAVGGKKTAEKAESVFVGVPNTTQPEAMLQVTYEAIRVERQDVPINLQIRYPASHPDSKYHFSIERGIEPGFDLVGVRFTKPVSESFVKNPKVSISADKKKVVLSGELLKTGSKSAPLPTWVAPMIVTLEKRSAPVKQTSDPVMVNLSVPGSTVVPMPKLAAGWVETSRKMTLELRDGANLVYRDSKMPLGAVVQMKSRPVRVTAVEQAGALRLDVVDNKTGFTPLGN